MVPHRQILQAIALSALCRPDGLGAVARFSTDCRVAFPCTLADFLTAHLFPELPAGLEAWLRSTDAALLCDYRPYMEAAAKLGLQAVVGVGPDGACLVLPTTIKKWRADDSLRIFLETCLLAGVAPAQIASDFKRMWGFDASEDDIRLFERLFVSREYIEGDCWVAYQRCIGEAEAKFKRDLMQQPHEYVRWKLGVPVELSNEKVLDRLISDAYFTERLIKAQSGENGIHMSRDEMARVKLERETLFKALGWKQKLKTVSADDDPTTNKVMAALAGMTVGYQSIEHVSIHDLDDAPSV